MAAGVVLRYRMVTDGGMAAKLARLGAAANTTLAKNTLTAGALVIQSAARENIKSQGLWKTGDFARSVSIEYEG